MSGVRPSRRGGGQAFYGYVGRSTPGLVTIAIASSLAACSLFTSLDGLSGGDGTDAGPSSNGSNDGGSGIVSPPIEDSGNVVFDAGATSSDDSGMQTTEPIALPDAGNDAKSDAGTQSGHDAGTDASPIDACVPSALVCDGKVHACDGVVDEGCPSALAIGASGSLQLLGGGSGGNAFDDTCPSNQVLVGIGGSTGQWIDSIWAICGAVSLKTVTSSDPYSYNVTIGSGKTLPVEGTDNASDTQWSAICPANTAVVSIAGNSGIGMDHLTLTCAPFVISGSPSSFALHQGSATVLAPQGDTGGGSPFTPVTWPDPQVITSVSGAAAQYVNSMAVACATPTVSFIK